MFIKNFETLQLYLLSKEKSLALHYKFHFSNETNRNSSLSQFRSRFSQYQWIESVVYSQVHRVTLTRFVLRKQGSGAERHSTRHSPFLYNTFQYKSVVPRRSRSSFWLSDTWLNQRRNEQVSRTKDAHGSRCEASIVPSYFLYQYHSPPFKVSLYQHNRKGSVVVPTLINRLRFLVERYHHASQTTSNSIFSTLP